MSNKFKMEIKESYGTCEEDLFELMAKNGDLTSIKVKDAVGSQVAVNGYALTHIETADKSFDLFYLDTDEYGLITSGSEIFANSIKTYIKKVQTFRILELKTKKGTTYKAVPVLKANAKKNDEVIEEADNEELPF